MAKIAAKGRDELLENTSDSAGPLAMAMLLGQRDYIDHATRDLLLVTGTAHLLSVSGMHLAILVMVANFLATFARLPLGFRITSILLFCLFYTLLTGGRPPVIRAAVLVTIFMTAVWLQRMNQPINTLSLAALILTLINPGNVLNVGVHLLSGCACFHHLRTQGFTEPGMIKTFPWTADLMTRLQQERAHPVDIENTSEDR